MALSRPCILAGTERADLHLGRTFDVEAEYVDADCYIHLSKTLAGGQAIRCLLPSLEDESAMTAWTTLFTTVEEHATALC